MGALIASGRRLMILSLEGYLARIRILRIHTSSKYLRSHLGGIWLHTACSPGPGPLNEYIGRVYGDANSVSTFRVPWLGSGFGPLFLLIFLDLNLYICNALLFWSDTLYYVDGEIYSSRLVSIFGRNIISSSDIFIDNNIPNDHHRYHLIHPTTKKRSKTRWS